MTELAVIFGLEGPRLTAGEKAFFRDCNPWGFILFGRNIETPDQVRALTQEIRACVGRNCLIFVDQEGGRVQRFKPPHWLNYPSGADLCKGYAENPAERKRAAYLHHRLIADDLIELGLNANCAPVLDIPLPDANPIISDRAFGDGAPQIIDMAHAAMAGLMNGGVAPVIKHIPGHGRAMVDSHLALPKVDASLDLLEATDFRPFKALSEAPMAMTAHIVYEAIDPNLPVTLSKSGISQIIREEIGFNGLLMSDDLDMKALSGSLRRKTEKALSAGCDVALQCSGKLPAMVQVASGAKHLDGVSKERADIAMMSSARVNAFDRDEALAEFELLAPGLRASA